MTTLTELVGENKEKATINENMRLQGFNYYNFPLSEEYDLIFDPSLVTVFPDMDGKLAKVELRITSNDRSNEYFTPLEFSFHAPSEHTIEGE